MSKKVTYDFTLNGCFIRIKWSSGKNISGDVTGYKFICDCRMVILYLMSGQVNIGYDNYSGPLTHEQWKAVFENMNCDEEVPLDSDKEYKETIPRVDPDTKEPVNIVVMMDKSTGLPCYYLENDLNTLININDYPMPNYGGLPQELLEQTTGNKGLEWNPAAGTYSFQDVLDYIVATRPDFLVDGVAPDGLIRLKIEPEYKGLPNVGATNTSQVATIQTAGGAAILASLNGGQSWCDEVKYVDGDCDGAVRNCIDLTHEVVTPGGVGFILEAIGVNCDTDDNDVNAQ